MMTTLTKSEALAQLQRDDFYLFCRSMSGFDWVDNWHLRYVAKKLQDVAEGRIKRLILTIPFRHAKSELASRCLPAWFLGHNPDKHVLGTSHSATLAKKMSRDVKRIIASDAYRAVFPGVALAGTKGKDASDEWDLADAQGGYIAKGAGQGIQGQGMYLGIIDDLYGSREDAYSEATRTKIEDWFENDLKTRLDKDGALVVINTRFHSADLIGYLKEQSDTHSDADEWVVINFPAIKENDADPADPREIGEALWPWRMSADELNALKQTRPDIYWCAYQGNPTPPGGTILMKADILFHAGWRTLDLSDAEIIQSYDLRHGGQGKHTSYAVAQLWAKIGPNAYLLDQHRGKWAPDETLEKILALNETPLWQRARAKLIEAKADGKTLIPMLKKHIAGIIPIEPKGSKEGRVMAVQPYFASHNIYVDKYATYRDEFVTECTMFPAGANDDQVDAASQALNHLYNRAAPKNIIALFG